jgi:hypothetical protein
MCTGSEAAPDQPVEWNECGMTVHEWREQQVAGRALPQLAVACASERAAAGGDFQKRRAHICVRHERPSRSKCPLRAGIAARTLAAHFARQSRGCLLAATRLEPMPRRISLSKYAPEQPSAHTRAKRRFESCELLLKTSVCHTQRDARSKPRVHPSPPGAQRALLRACPICRSSLRKHSRAIPAT